MAQMARPSQLSAVLGGTHAQIGGAHGLPSRVPLRLQVVGREQEDAR
jgi:hypothetical protein